MYDKENALLNNELALNGINEPVIKQKPGLPSANKYLTNGTVEFDEKCMHCVAYMISSKHISSLLSTDIIYTLLQTIRTLFRFKQHFLNYHLRCIYENSLYI